MNNMIANIRTQLRKLKCRIANLTKRVAYIEDNCCNGGGGDIEAIDVSYDDATTQLGVDNTQLAIEKVYEKAIVKDYINIIDFGAVGDGVTESAKFIQDALDFAEANGIRRVYAPAGTYLLEKTIYIPTEIEFYGDGMDKTVFKIDAETVLDIITMFEGSTQYQNFYSPVISTKTTRTGATLNNILLKDFKIDDIYYDDTGLTTRVCPMLILNTKNSTVENVEFGNVQTEEEQDGTSRFSLGLSIAFSENLLIDKCVHGFAGYESLSIRFLSKNITSRENVFNIDKPDTLAAQVHCAQTARPTALVSALDSAYGENRCEHYTADGDVYNMIAGVMHAFTAHASDYTTIQNTIVNSNGNTVEDWVFKPFDTSKNVIITGNTINYIEPSEAYSTAPYSNGLISIGSTGLNNLTAQVANYVVSNNILNVELNRDLSALSERDITPLIGNMRTKFHNTTITNNVVNVTGTGIRDQAVFGFYGTNIIASGNVVNFDGIVSYNMRAFVVEGGDRINVINNSTTGNHEYSLKVNNVESLENLIIGANNFSSITLNNQETRTEVIVYKSDTVSKKFFYQYTTSTLSGDDGGNLIVPDLGLPILEVEDIQENSSYSGELVLNIENNNITTAKVIELFGAEIYNNTNPSSDITAKITFTLDFFNQVGDDIDYKLSWEYLSSGEVLFGEHTGTIDNTSNVDFELLVTGHSTDIFNLKKANLKRVADSESRILTTGTKWHSKLTRYYNNVIKSQGNSSSILPYLNLINEKLIENDGQVMFLTYSNATELILRIQTQSGNNWEVDWDGSGVWQTWTSSATNNRTKTFTSPTSGVAFIRSATGNSIEDINYVYSTGGNWNFDISALSSVNYYIYFDGSLMALTGDISALSNVSYHVRFSGDNMTLTGDISALSSVNYYIYFDGSLMALTGDISALSNVSYHVLFWGDNMTLTGDISALSNVSYSVYFRGDNMTLTGDISVLSNVSYRVYFNGSLMTLTGDISALSNVSYIVRFDGSSMTLTYTTTTWATIPSNTFYIRLSSGRLTQTEIDQLFIDLNNAGTTGNATIDLRGSNAAPSSASASARTALAGRGYNLLHN